MLVPIFLLLNSIRLGSTVQNKPNEWSSVGENGDPILIIRNGQPSGLTQDSWIPTTENINQDQSSAYFTKGQKLLSIGKIHGKKDQN